MGWEDPDPAEIVRLETNQSWSQFSSRYGPNVFERPFKRCLEVARQGGTRTVVVETRYLDIDYRSEYSSFFSKTFAEIPDTAHRLHFFAADVDGDDLGNLPDQIRQAYVGYMVVRPSPLGRVGRTLLTPPPELASAIQTAVNDRVDFFGEQLEVTGVPFAQQDTQFGRCAHVAAWTCHHTAYLRGDVARRPMADFSIFADASVAEGRPLPSQGLTGLQLSNLMREFDLPPILYRMGFIPESGQEPAVPAHGPDQDPGTWDTRAIAVLCRFLNSRYPVLVGTHDHAFTVVGYWRGSNTNSITFVRHDDQRGPYLLVHDVLDDVDDATGDQYSPWQLLLAPVPDKLWLLPEAAERTGRDYLLGYDREVDGYLTAKAKRNQLTYRTTAMSATDYKRRAVGRGLTAETIREIRLARLSRLVWVVEAVDKTARAKATPSVLGEVVFDSTSSDVDPNVLLLRVPGAMLVRQTDGTIRSPLPAGNQAVNSAAHTQP